MTVEETLSAAVASAEQVVADAETAASTKKVVAETTAEVVEEVSTAAAKRAFEEIQSRSITIHDFADEVRVAGCSWVLVGGWLWSI